MIYLQELLDYYREERHPDEKHKFETMTNHYKDQSKCVKCGLIIDAAYAELRGKEF